MVANVPFVDALNTELDATLPLTVGEWRSGATRPEEYYDYIKSYAHTRTRQGTRKYSSLQAKRSTCVSYWEPEMGGQAPGTKERPRILLLKTQMGSGHFGASGRYERWKETAFNYAFILHELDLE